MSGRLIVLLFGVVGSDDVRVMHPIAEFVKPVLGVRRGWSNAGTDRSSPPSSARLSLQALPMFVTIAIIRILASHL